VIRNPEKGIRGRREVVNEGGREAGRQGGNEETYLVQVSNLLFQGGEEVEGYQLGSFLGIFWRDLRTNFTRYELPVRVGGEVASCVRESVNV